MRRRVVLLTFLCIFLVPALVYANSAPGWFPDWSDDYNTLWAYWQWQGPAWSFMPPTAMGANPGLNSPLLVTGPQADGHLLGIWADNYNQMNPYKEGWIKIGSTDQRAWGMNVTIDTADYAEVTNLEKTAQYDMTINDRIYYFTEWSFTIEPNPCFENIYFDLNVTGFFDDVNCVGANCPPPVLNYVGLATKCVVPIPGAVWLFGAGLVGLLGFRKRFKK